MEQQGRDQQFKFDVFISYRHADLDSAVAGYLQKALEHYRIPREIRKKCGKTNIRRVFRDEEELGVASDLFSEIEENLKQSEFLLVVCSPRIVESKWCLREIETFIKYRGRENVLAVLIEGEPDVSFPPILLEQGEPLAADLRGRDKRHVLRHARERMPRLVAPLIYCSYDELYQRHRVYKMRRALALASLTAVVALGFGAVAVTQNMEITRNYQAKLENQSRYLAQKSAVLLNQGDREAALLVALAALPESSTDDSRPYVAEARIALENALYTYTPDVRLRPMNILEHKSAPLAYSDYNYDEMVMLTLDSEGRVYIWDGETNKNLCCWEESGRSCEDARFIGNRHVAAKTSQGLVCFDYTTSEVLWEWSFPECGGVKCLAESSSALVGGSGWQWDYDAVSGTIVCVRERIECEHGPEDETLQVFDAHLFYVVDAGTGESRTWRPDAVYRRLEEDASLSIRIEDIAFSPDGQKLLVKENRGRDLSRQTYDYGLYVLPMMGDETVFYQEYLNSRGLKEAVWLDGERLGIVEVLEGGVYLETVGYECRWQLTCWELARQQPWITYQDSSLALYGNVTIETNYPVAEGTGTVPVISVIYDNVMVNLDWYTGEQYSRIEDRSTLMCIQNSSADTNALLLATADGYVFFSGAVRDYVYNPLYNTQHYYLALDTIRKAEWHNRRAYFYTDKAVYCYSTTYALLTDEAYVPLELSPVENWFDEESPYLLLAGHVPGAFGHSDGKVCLYDTEAMEALWQDDCFYGTEAAAAWLDGGYVVYMDVDGEAVKIHSVQEGTDIQVRLERGQRAVSQLDEWCLEPASDELALVWNTRMSRIDADLQEGEQTQEAVVWLVDAAQGTVKAQWSCRDILEQFSDYSGKWQEGESSSAGLGSLLDSSYLSVSSASVTGDEKLLVISACLRHAQDNEIRLAVWDLENGQPIVQPEEIWQGLAADGSGAYYRQDGWLSPDSSIAVLYDARDRRLRVVDLAEGRLLHELPVDGIGSNEVSFTPDGEHLIFQDGSRRLCVYQWRNGEYTMMNTSPETGSLSFSFHQDGEVVSARMNAGGFASETVRMYRYVKKGVYRLETVIGSCLDCDGKVAVSTLSRDARLYRFHDLDALIAWAKEVLNGRELTPLEREDYLID